MTSRMLRRRWLIASPARWPPSPIFSLSWCSPTCRWWSADSARLKADLGRATRDERRGLMQEQSLLLQLQTQLEAEVSAADAGPG